MKTVDKARFKNGGIIVPLGKRVFLESRIGSNSLLNPEV